MHFDLEHVVPAPVGRTFDAIADITRRPEWVGIAEQRVPLSEGPPASGARYRAVDRIPGRTVTYTQTIDRLEPDSVLEESWDGPMEGHTLVRFIDEGASTRVTIEADVASPVPRALSFLEPVARRWAVRVFSRDLARLDDLVA